MGKSLVCATTFHYTRAIFFDKPLVTRFLRAVDRVLVHTPEQAKVAKSITKAPISIADMPPHLPAKAKSKHSTALQKHLLFFGMVRPYKGVDILLKALAKTPGVSLTIAGEIWGGVAGGGNGQEGYEQLIATLSLQNRVTLLPGYVPSQRIPELFAEADALVLPYRSGTATQNVTLAYEHGIPVIATSVGSMTNQVHDNIDGLLCKPDNVASLAAAIQHFYEPGVAAKLRKQLPTSVGDDTWDTYVQTLVS